MKKLNKIMLIIEDVFKYFELHFNALLITTSDSAIKQLWLLTNM